MGQTHDSDGEELGREIMEAMGTVIGNLLTLELSLRLILHNWEVELGVCDWSLPDDWEPGQWIPETAMTMPDNLKDVIKKANSLFSMRGLKYRVDPSLVDLRHNLAHGRLLATFTPDLRVVLWRFSRPRASDGRVKVLFAQDITLEWLGEQTHRVYEEILNVEEVGVKLGLLQ